MGIGRVVCVAARDVHPSTRLYHFLPELPMIFFSSNIADHPSLCAVHNLSLDPFARSCLPDSIAS
ncbi:unnamed protein product [Periconia digitata]|uniref:Uncharacterized protein n=1 Tax=Periconia digitata TaxID=1303443 RepID=A0A9W4XHA3_9PLEO|nr:unnamed protein product [Periconia digitata]